MVNGNGLSIESSGLLKVSPATSSALGGVKVGSGLSVASDGTLSLGQDQNKDIISDNYSYTTGDQFISEGLMINLVNGQIFTPAMSIMESSHDVHVQGIRVRPKNAEDVGDHFVRIEDVNVDNYIVASKSDITKVSNGTTYGVEWTTSDERVKEEILYLNPDLSKKLIDATEPKKFTYKNSEGTHYGMIAQEARAILDALGEWDSMLEHSMGDTTIEDQRTINYQEYIPHLINYVKMLQNEIDILKSKLGE